jgi:hypothetical protein
MISQDNAMVESDGSAKKRVVRPPTPSQELADGRISR